MKCLHCESENLVRNGSSRHGRQRWLCRDCGRMCGKKNFRQVDPSIKAAALALYAGEGAIGRLNASWPVSHVAVMHWVAAVGLAKRSGRKKT